MPPEPEILSVTPSKRLLRALAVDINLEDAVTDLIDNSIDQWISGGRKGKLQVAIEVALNTQALVIEDNAGGVSKEDLPLLVAPGATNRSDADDTFGIFGVGSKRALYLLGQEAQIFTRVKGEPGYRVDLTREWFSTDTGPNRWDVPCYEDSSTRPGITRIVVKPLRTHWTEAELRRTKDRIRQTYSGMLKEGSVRISLNKEDIVPSPPPPFAWNEDVPLTKIKHALTVPKTDRSVQMEMLLGVLTKPQPLSEIGFDVICNGRLIVAHVADFRLGFEEGQLGTPHFTINRFRGIIKLEGHPRDMPWNSSKSDLNLNHPVYRALRGIAIQTSHPFTKFLRQHYDETTQMFSRAAGEDDVKVVDLRHRRSVPKLVKDRPRKKRKNVVTVRYQVGQVEFDRAAAHIGYEDRKPGEVGKYAFDYFYERVVKGGED